MSATSSSIPAPEVLARAWLAHAPPWLRRAVATALSVLAWVGLPSTVLSTVANLTWVIDACRWLYVRADALRPFLGAVGDGLIALVDLWRAFTHPIWEAALGWLPFTIPSYVPDLLTLLSLVGVGALRAQLYRVGRERYVHANLQLATADAANVSSDIPVAFDGFAHFERKRGRKLTRPQRRRIERLWSAFRLAAQARRDFDYHLLHLGRGVAYGFEPRHFYGQFYEFWRASEGSRAILSAYAVAACLVAVALLIEWAI